MSASSSLSAAGLRERLDELLAAASSASRDGARLQEDLGLLRSVLGGNIEPSVTPDIARVAVSVLEKVICSASPKIYSLLLTHVHATSCFAARDRWYH